MNIIFENRVAIVTGGGNGLGREYCLALAARGAKVVVNDLGGSVDGSGASGKAAMGVVEEIRSAGGEAIANGADVTDHAQVESMVAKTKELWGRVDILINNAGILRDKTFSKMSHSDFDKVVNVHLFGAVNCTKAVWETMRDQKFGRILMTTSSSGLFGNFGQSNYAAAKAALVGLMNVLHREGAKYDIRINTLAPTAATRMLSGLIPDHVAPIMDPKTIAPGVLYLVSDDAPSKVIMGAGCGAFSVVIISETPGVFLGTDASVDDVAERWCEISSGTGASPLENAGQQTEKFIKLAAEALGVDLAGKAQ